MTRFTFSVFAALLMAAGTAQAQAIDKAPVKHAPAASGACLLLLDDALFQLSQQEYGVIAIDAYLRGQSRASAELLALAGATVSLAFGAAIPLEVVCDSPGLGHLAWQAATARDLPVLVALTLLVTLHDVDLAQIALDVRLGATASHGDVVDLLYANLTGVHPGAEAAKVFIDLLNKGTYSPATLTLAAAWTDLEAQRIDLVGLSASGLEYEVG